MKKTLVEIVFMCGGLALILWLLFQAFVLWANEPQVKKSWSTKECIEVISMVPEHDCNNIPKRYDVVWVQ